VIATPENDHACLDAITEEIAGRLRDRDPAIVAIAEAHPTTAALAQWLRSLPQRDDHGTPHDGPKVDACDPPQRLRLPAADPNCVERAATYLAAAELIDPVPVRALATTDTPGGLHTYPVEDGRPVVLDPQISRNALAARRFHDHRARNGSAPVELTPRELIAWLADIAVEPAARFDRGAERVARGHRALCLVLDGRPLCVVDLRDVAFVLALADREARQWGPLGPRMVATAARAVDQLDQAAAGRPPAPPATARNVPVPELRVGDTRIRPDMQILGALGRIGGRLGYAAGVEALRIKLAGLGVGGPVLNTLERELQREGPVARAAGQAAGRARVAVGDDARGARRSLPRHQALTRRRPARRADTTPRRASARAPPPPHGADAPGARPRSVRPQGDRHVRDQAPARERHHHRDQAPRAQSQEPSRRRRPRAPRRRSRRPGSRAASTTTRRWSRSRS
jgi:hypothetical protein